MLEGSSSARMTPRYSPGYPVPQEWKVGNHFVLHITNRLMLFKILKEVEPVLSEFFHVINRENCISKAILCQKCYFGSFTCVQATLTAYWVVDTGKFAYLGRLSLPLAKISSHSSHSLNYPA